MALSTAKHEKFYETSGSGSDKVSTKDLTQATTAWADSKANGCKRYLGDPALAPLVYQLQQMQDEIDYLRTEISSNKDKVSMTLGTSGSTALAGDTNIVTIGSSTTIAFGDMVTVPPKVKGGKTTYNIVMTVTNGGVSKATTLTLT
jgi:hypothetical protein